MKHTRLRSRPTRAVFLAFVSSAAVATATLASPTAVGAAPDSAADSASLREAVTTAGVMDHMEAFQDIADAHAGTRASGTPGYAASRDYVVGKLRAAGYQPVVQQFDFPFYRQLATATFEQVSPTPTAYQDGTDFGLMTYSASGNVTAPVQAVDLALSSPATSTSGCEESDFNGFTRGNIALVQRGTCTFGVKQVNAQHAGASAVIVMNQGTAGRTGPFVGTLGAPVATVPSLGTSFTIGQALASGATAHIVASTESEIRPTWNVHADSQAGDREHLVHAGAHLDSVVAGPGINDNGSGSAALLEVAEQMANVRTTNRVRYSWWGAEELGLLGSRHYVNDLEANQPSKLRKTKLYLNFDMVGSPNYALFVYDGDNSAFPVGPGAAEGPEGSGQIEKLFHDYFESQGMPSAETPFSGRSDYGPFIERGIPAGGLFTGAEGVKTASQAELFGGTAGVAYDSCYHIACDTIGNVNEDAIDANSDAIAHAVLTYAQDLSSLMQPVSGAVHGDGTPGGGGLHDDDHELPSS
ncbi:aminopeptidase [Nocardioides gansuensis]|uniref:Aminopeptidase n=1 Tax=Nocardioides gansuensis TaxID=2138300 RepID=A0A2T8FFD9_9ACTN|nr:M28 family metallopeptidase [Nocardioides gansuensis]PVG84426.1 aminopeptidase [Nocardioides gansuensis]